MGLEKYVDEITLLIEKNIKRLSLKFRLKRAHYSMSTENLFELTYEEHERLSEIIEEISHDLNLENKFPQKFIFDKLVKEVIIKSYNYSSTTSEIKSALKIRFKEFEKILRRNLMTGHILFLLLELILNKSSIWVKCPFIHLTRL